VQEDYPVEKRRPTVAEICAINESRQHSLNNDGYYRLSKSEVASPEGIAANLALGVTVLNAHGYPATAIMMYDEAWILGSVVQSLVQPSSRNEPINDYYVFMVDADSTYTPGPAHRDRPSADDSSFRHAVVDPIDLSNPTNPLDPTDPTDPVCVSPELTPEGPEPKYVSVWVALSDCTPENSCLYVLPRRSDPGYHGVGDAVQPYSVQSIVCQPILQGGLLVFSHRLLHWGSYPVKGQERTARIAFSCAFADSSFEGSYFDNDLYLPFPPLGLRLGLISGQQIQYAHLVPSLTKEELKLHQRIFCSQKNFFADKYYQKIASAAQFLIFMKSRKN
jgi:hypothetical protein